CPSLARSIHAPTTDTSTHFFSFHHEPTPTELYTLSLHDALPIYRRGSRDHDGGARHRRSDLHRIADPGGRHQHDHRLGGQLQPRSEEHTSELQSRGHLVCRLLLEKKKSQILAHQREMKAKMASDS